MEGRCLGGKRVTKVSLTFTENFTEKINRLSISCSKPTSELLFEIIKACLNTSSFVESIQQVYNKGEYWVRTEPEKEGLRYIVEPFMNETKIIRYSIKKDKLFLLGRRTEKIDVSLTNKAEGQANTLAKALGCSRAQLLALIVMFQLESPAVLNDLMERYLINPKLRLLHVKRNDEVYFEYFYAN